MKSLFLRVLRGLLPVLLVGAWSLACIVRQSTPNVPTRDSIGSSDQAPSFRLTADQAGPYSLDASAAITAAFFGGEYPMQLNWAYPNSGAGAAGEVLKFSQSAPGYYPVSLLVYDANGDWGLSSIGVTFAEDYQSTRLYIDPYYLDSTYLVYDEHYYDTSFLLPAYFVDYSGDTTLVYDTSLSFKLLDAAPEDELPAQSGQVAELFTYHNLPRLTVAGPVSNQYPVGSTLELAVNLVSGAPLATLDWSYQGAADIRYPLDFGAPEYLALPVPLDGDLYSYDSGAVVYKAVPLVADLLNPGIYQLNITAVNELGQVAVASYHLYVPSITAGTALIPAGEFSMGRDSKELYAAPAHQVYLSEYWIDKREVSNLAYARFMPDYWQSLGYHRDKQPVTGVSWYEAAAFCAASGKRLPTEAEWEKACRGPDNRLYGYGDTADKLRCNNDTEALVDSGAYERCSNAYGVYDMVGNAAEWVADSFDPEYYAGSPYENPTGPEKLSLRSVRGGSFVGPVASCATRRYSLLSVTNDKVGFRCVFSK